MIKFLGHAGFMYESKNEMILMDPWMSKEGAFDSSWYQFPSNHKLGDEIRETISKTEKDVYIYISHEHKDHFDVPFLKTLELSKINFNSISKLEKEKNSSTQIQLKKLKMIIIFYFQCKVCLKLRY